MRYGGTSPLVLSAALCWSAVTSTLAEPVSCRRPPPDREVLRFEHTHEVTVYQVMRGPDAIEFEVARVVPATDELILWRVQPQVVCVVLTSFDSRGLECGVAGVAMQSEAGEFVLTEEACRLRFSVDHDRIELRAPPSGCGAGYCNRNGVIEDAAYVRR